MDKAKTHIPENLKFLMKKKKMTLEDLSEKLGVTKQAVSAYCTGKYLPALSILIKIAEVFNVSIDYLVTGVSPENKTVAEELGLSDNALENLKGIAFEGGDSLSSHLDDLLSDKKFFEAFFKAFKYRDGIASYLSSVEKENKEKMPEPEREDLIASIESSCVRKLSSYFYDSRMFSVKND